MCNIIRTHEERSRSMFTVPKYVFVFRMRQTTETERILSLCVLLPYFVGCMHEILVVYPYTQYSKIWIVLGCLDPILYSFLSVIRWLMFIFTFIRNKYGVECRLCWDDGEYREYKEYTKSIVHCTHFNSRVASRDYWNHWNRKSYSILDWHAVNKWQSFKSKWIDFVRLYVNHWTTFSRNDWMIVNTQSKNEWQNYRTN